MEIEVLLNQPESKTLEFKRDLSSLNPILKTIVAFANTAGGMLIIGRSSDGILLGVDIFKAEEKIANAIAENIRPPLLPEIEIVTQQGKDLIVLKVAYWRGPFYVKKLGIPHGVYVRLGSTSRPAGPELLAEMQRSTLHIAYDQQAFFEASKSSLNKDKINRIFKQVEKKITNEKLQSLGILMPSPKGLVPTIGGLILFGEDDVRERFFPDARISCARFLGDDKAKFLDRYNVEGTIIDAVDLVPKFITRNTRLMTSINMVQRTDIPEYSPIALREALMNALVHCDYSLVGSHIQIAIFDNRLEIQNPGMFPFGFTIDDFKSGVSRVRNRVIARVFRELGFIEEWGSGYKRIVKECVEGGYPKPKWDELGSFIRVTFYPRSQEYLDTSKEKKITEDLTPRQMAILTLFKLGESLSFQDILKSLSFTISERTLHYDLAALKDKGFLLSQGKARATLWRLK